MKYNLLVIFVVTIYSCSIFKIKKEDKKTSLDLTSYNSENFDFSVIVYDCDDNNYFIFNDSLSKIPFSPASTFKIANAIVALENRISESKTGWNACRLNPTHLPRNQNAKKQKDRQTHPQGKRSGHFVFGWRRPLLRGHTAPHHVKQSPDQTGQDGDKCDNNQYFHGDIIR